MDTKGYFDTQANVSNETILNEIMSKVTQTVKMNGVIRTITLVWSPNCQFRFEEMIESLKKKLGDEVVNSLIVLVNHRRKSLDSEDEEKIENVKKFLQDIKLGFVPVIVSNVKKDKNLVEKLNDELKIVRSYPATTYFEFRKKLAIDMIEQQVAPMLLSRTKKMENEEKAERIREEENKRRAKEL